MKLQSHHDPCVCHEEDLHHVILDRGGNEGRDVLKVVTLNVRHGRGGAKRPGVRQTQIFKENVQRVAEFLKEVSADVVALQEADGPSFWSGSHHHVKHISEYGEYGEYAHGLHVSFCRPRLGLSYGTALLSRLPLTGVESHPFRARPLDSKGFVIATTSLNGGAVDVVSTHLDLVKPVQKRQASTLIRFLKRRRLPVILMGDMNSTGKRRSSSIRKIADALDLEVFAEDRDLPTYPSWRPTMRLDWILISRELEFRSFRLLPTTVSDHVAVAASIGFQGESNGER